MRLIRLLYNIAFPFVLLVLLPGFLFRMAKRGKYRHKFGQRFGIYSPRVRRKLAQGGWTWVHAVSVGEVLIALKLIRELKKSDPELRVVLSTTTSTGYALASRETSEWLEAIYNPVDFFWTAKRAVKLIRPRLMILVEAEIWPNITAEARAQGAKLALINARLSTRSEKRYRMARVLVAPIFGQLDLACVQEPADAERWAALGVKRENILCTGSIKFDDAVEEGRVPRDFRPTLRELGVADEAPVLFAASTHAGEEEILGRIYLRLREKFPNLFYLVAPRHAERGKDIQASLERLGLKTVLRAGGEEPSVPPDTLIVNTTGELRDWFRCAQAVFIGKSLTAKGGQNPVEAVAAGKPVVFGPNMQNFATITAQFVREHGAVQAADEAGVEQTLREFLENPKEASLLAERGAACLAGHRGATQRTVEALAKLAGRSEVRR